MDKDKQITTLPRFTKESQFTSIEEGLNELCSYGKPSLRQMDQGWYCNINVFVTGVGVAFEVRSEFTEPSPFIAIHVCYTRLIEALSKLGVEV